MKMNITKEMDSFDVFNLKEDATEEEIKKQFELRVEMYCGEDGKKQNANGEYLFNIYQEHYKRLMNSEERAKLIEQRRLRLKNNDALHGSYETAPVAIKSSRRKEKNLITLINREIVQKYSEMQPRRTFSLKRYSLTNGYVVFGEDCSLLFTECVYIGNSGIRYNAKTGKFENPDDAPVYTLNNCFTGQDIFGTDIVLAYNDLPWIYGELFEVQGVSSFAFMASKIFPNFLIHNGKIKDCDFRQAYDIISKYIHANPDYVASLFEGPHGFEVPYEEEEEEEEVEMGFSGDELPKNGEKQKKIINK